MSAYVPVELRRQVRERFADCCAYSATDPETGQSVPLFQPHQDSWNDHFAWSVDGTELVGLTPTGRAAIAAFRMNRPQLVRLRRIWMAQDEHPPVID